MRKDSFDVLAKGLLINNQMKKFFKDQREYLAVAAFFVILGMLGYFVVLPLLKKIADIKNEIEEGYVIQDIKKQRLAELPKIRQQYLEIGNQQEKMNVLLVKENAVLVIERLEKLAQDTNNKIVISVQEGNSPKGVFAEVAADKAATDLVNSLPSKNYLKLKVSLLGGYEDLLKFLSSLETLEYYSDIVGINISHATDSEMSSLDKAVKNSDVLNPFSVSAIPSVKVLPKKVNNTLATSLDVVFYTKK